MPTTKVIFYTPPEVHLLDICGPAHIFYEAREYGADLTLHYIATDHHTNLNSSGGLAFTGLTPYQDLALSKDDILFIPGLQWELLSRNDFQDGLQPFFQWMITQHAKGVTICSVCTGAFLVAGSGLLDEAQCTTHWRYVDRFRAKFPRVQLLDNRLFVEDKGIYTSAGVSSGIDLALYLLELRYGSRFASDIAREVVVYLRRGEDDPQLSVFLKYRNHQESRVHEVQNWLSQHLANVPKIDELADKVCTSPRNLTRLFKKVTGITVGEYIENLRIETAIHLLSEGNKVEAVARETGLKSANRLREILKRHTGKLPRAFQ
ncbi:helix-turn-helix domain-containing protein [Fulvivirga sp. M361]|uniref:GlxA family transcriptional regulator n=1 Tax=Fulvivirga sp. M361 TaxID=2594266 RepID=UPI00117A03ED|nr:helix-turn-helix domain-containing protein [Fulvivirga sp. M361]TRX57674.1 helix-turn-helix domain-containing protein [Fulvivirga sp. M361]